MKAADIETGVVYSWQPSRWRDKPEPCVFLSTDLYRRPPADGPGWAEKTTATKASSGFRTRLGYVLVRPDRRYRGDHAALVPAMLELTADAITGIPYNDMITPDLEAHCIGSAELGCIRGIYWEEASAAEQRADKAAQAKRERDEVLATRRARASAVATSFHRANLTVPRFNHDTASVTMSLALAERVAALLDKEG